MKNLHINKTTMLGIFASSLLVTASAVYLYSPTFGSHADTSNSAEVSLTVGEAMSLSLDKNNLALTADINSFTSGDITATAVTNSQYGYTLTLEDVDASSNMTHTNSSITDVLTSSFAGAKASAEMSNNTWGFSLNATDFYRVPENGSPVAIKRTDSPMTTDSEETTITFGTKVGNITSGTYTDSVLFTIYTNGQEPEIPPTEPGYVNPCSTAAYVSNGILTDPRDGKTYTVKALKDGQCWMTQNLALIDAELTSENSNLPEGETWTIPASDKSLFSNDYDVNSAYLDPHFGGYYSFYTATAGWGTYELTTGISPKDICPKGWRLPTGRFGDFQNLYTYYPSPSLMVGESGLIFGGEVDHNAIFSQGGYDGMGGVGYYWSSTIDINAHDRAYGLYAVGDSYVDPINSYYKNYGLSVRCVAKQ